jgi:signal peptidase
MKRVLNIALIVLRILLLAFAVFVLIMTLLSSFSFNKEEGIFGYKLYIVLSDSMRGVFNVGDVAVSCEVKDTSELGEGDIITFRSIDPANYGAVVTHKIRGRTEHEGKPAFITYGTATGADDMVPALEERVLGKYIFAIPKMGYVFSNLKTPLGYVFIVLLPFGLLIGFEAVNFIKLFREYKKELKEEAGEKVQALESENLRLREMMEKMAQQQSGETQTDEEQAIEDSEDNTDEEQPVKDSEDNADEEEPVEDSEDSEDNAEEPVENSEDNADEEPVEDNTDNADEEEPVEDSEDNVNKDETNLINSENTPDITEESSGETSS